MKKQNGITLIALVITMIVLLILAGVSISMIIGNNGILAQATSSVNETKKAAVREEIGLAWAGIESEFLGEWTEDTSKQKSEYFTESKLNEFLGETGIVSELVYNANGTSTLKYTSKADGLVYELEIDASGKATVVGEPSQEDEEDSEEGNTATVVEMYEALAGDEEGATEGKIHIGDYVNYNPNPDNLTTAEMTEENGYKYVSENSQTGLSDDISDGQVFTVQSGLKWRVIGVEGTNLLITTEIPINPDTPVTYSGKTGYLMFGIPAYYNIETEITNISKIYANGEGAVKELSRGMTIKDIDNISGVVATEATVTPTGINLYDAQSGTQPYGTQLTNFKAGTEYGWNPSAWLAASDEDRDDESKAPGVTETISAYTYQGSNSALKTASSAIRNNLVFGPSNSYNYWLASRGVAANYDVVGFGPSNVYEGIATSIGASYFSDGSTGTGVSGVRPVVALAADITLTEPSTTDGITTWNIE